MVYGTCPESVIDFRIEADANVSVEGWDADGGDGDVGEPKLHIAGRRFQRRSNSQFDEKLPHGGTASQRNAGWHKDTHVGIEVDVAANVRVGLDSAAHNIAGEELDLGFKRDTR